MNVQLTESIPSAVMVLYIYKITIIMSTDNSLGFYQFQNAVVANVDFLCERVEGR